MEKWQTILYAVLGAIGAIAVLVIVIAGCLICKEKRDKKRKRKDRYEILKVISYFHIYLYTWTYEKGSPGRPGPPLGVGLKTSKKKAMKKSEGRKTTSFTDD